MVNLLGQCTCLTCRRINILNFPIFPGKTLPEETILAAEIADSIETIQNCRAEVEPAPSDSKSVSSRCWCFGRSSADGVCIRFSTFEKMLKCSFSVRPSARLKCTLEFRKIHCLCVSSNNFSTKSWAHRSADMKR